jgi:hypothetical protein
MGAGPCIRAEEQTPGNRGPSPRPIHLPMARRQPGTNCAIQRESVHGPSVAGHRAMRAGLPIDRLIAQPIPCNRRVRVLDQLPMQLEMRCSEGWDLPRRGRVDQRLGEARELGPLRPLRRAWLRTPRCRQATSPRRVEGWRLGPRSWFPPPPHQSKRPLLWRVGTHINGCGACPVFTARCGPHYADPPKGPYLGVLQPCRCLHEPPQGLSAGATVRRAGIAPAGNTRLPRRLQQPLRAAT